MKMSGEIGTEQLKPVVSLSRIHTLQNMGSRSRWNDVNKNTTMIEEICILFIYSTVQLIMSKNNILLLHKYRTSTQQNRHGTVNG